ncbi:hypothetical protein POTOM_041593 [Populus tomentosa]|uniref:Uncharacterized protein n=1 Tax=Populus tomentosa TaxID=118781 RepID=A0A8X7YME5_POPTO|nr:hypothetical protein POTOM_041593 [Populus tomentosa]
MMDRSTPTMRYQARKRDPKFLFKWVVRLVLLNTVAVLSLRMPHQSFPFFCGDREYIIGRQIWESGRSYFCVMKGVPCSSVPRRDKFRRVDLYYSSWCIRAVELRRGDGQLTAYEGMWGTIKKIEHGLHAYQKARALGAELSRPAFIAQINTKINPELLRSLGGDENLSENEATTTTSEKSLGQNIPKLLIFCGAIILACSFDRGLLTKAFIFNMGRRFGNMGRNARLNAGTT